MVRPAKFTPETIAQLVEVLQKGAFIEEACAYASISTGTFYEWYHKGEAAKNGKYFDFT